MRSSKSNVEQALSSSKATWWAVMHLFCFHESVVGGIQANETYKWQKFSQSWLRGKKTISLMHILNFSLSSEPEEHICQHCQKVLRSERSLRAHEMIHTGVRFFRPPVEEILRFGLVMFASLLVDFLGRARRSRDSLIESCTCHCHKPPPPHWLTPLWAHPPL